LTSGVLNLFVSTCHFLKDDIPGLMYYDKYMETQTAGNSLPPVKDTVPPVAIQSVQNSITTPKPIFILLLIGTLSIGICLGLGIGFFVSYSPSANPKSETFQTGNAPPLPVSEKIANGIPTAAIFPTLLPTLSQTPTLSPTASAMTTNTTPFIGKCTVFPADNPWNQDISKLPVNQLSDAYITSIGTNKSLHPDFGGASSGNSWGIPFMTVTNAQKMLPITFTASGNESDPGPYPVPLNAPIEGGSNSTGDRHVLVVNTDTCKLYELYLAFPTQTGWKADSGAVFDLTANTLRPAGWTSADAAGLPIFPGLIKYDEVAKGSVNHAIRFTTRKTQRSYIYPARHYASSSPDKNLPPMGLRLRLKANYDISHLTPQAKIIATAMKKYGLILADNGGDWFFQGDTNPSWNDEDINTLKTIPGSAFEAVDTGSPQQ
jgi:hypothetical protein